MLKATMNINKTSVQPQYHEQQKTQDCDDDNIGVDNDYIPRWDLKGGMPSASYIARIELHLHRRPEGELTKHWQSDFPFHIHIPVC